MKLFPMQFDTSSRLGDSIHSHTRVNSTETTGWTQRDHLDSIFALTDMEYYLFLLLHLYLRIVTSIFYHFKLQLWFNLATVNSSCIKAFPKASIIGAEAVQMYLTEEPISPRCCPRTLERTIKEPAWVNLWTHVPTEKNAACQS